jgi:hypothetical protein
MNAGHLAYYDTAAQMTRCSARHNEQPSCKYFLPSRDGGCAHHREDVDGACDNAYACFEAWGAASKINPR